MIGTADYIHKRFINGMVSMLPYALPDSLSLRMGKDRSLASWWCGHTQSESGVRTTTSPLIPLLLTKEQDRGWCIILERGDIMMSPPCARYYDRSERTFGDEPTSRRVSRV